MTYSARLVLLVAALLVATACASPQPLADKPLSPPSESDPYYNPADLPPGPDVLPEYAGDDQAAADDAAGPVSRAALDAFLQRGPHHPLTLVQLQPSFDEGRFVGFQVTSLTDRGREVLGGAVRPGDVILQINGHDIARPEDYMGAWESLKTCSTIEVELLRSGQRTLRSWPVENKSSRPTTRR